MTPDEVLQLELDHQAFLQSEIQEEVDIYDTKGEYIHTETRD